MGRTSLRSLFDPCVRYHSMVMDEKHLCWMCGYPIPVTLPYHSCKTMIMCPNCGVCGCNMSKEVLDALVRLRNKFCCRPYHFVYPKAYVTEQDLKDGLLVPNYFKTLEHCRNLEKEIL